MTTAGHGTTTGTRAGRTSRTTRATSPRTNDGQRDELLPLADVLAELHVPKSTFFRWKAIGKAPRTIKYPNGSLHIRRADLEAWLTEHEEPLPR